MKLVETKYDVVCVPTTKKECNILQKHKWDNLIYEEGYGNRFVATNDMVAALALGFRQVVTIESQYGECYYNGEREIRVTHIPDNGEVIIAYYIHKGMLKRAIRLAQKVHKDIRRFPYKVDYSQYFRHKFR